MLKEAGVVQDGGRGADGGEPAVGAVLMEHKFADAWIGPEMFHAGTSGKEDAIVVAGERSGQSGIGVAGDSRTTGDVNALGESGDGYLDFAATQEVDRGNGFNFLKTFGKNCENGRHTANVRTMSDFAPGNLRGKRLVVLGCGYVGSALAREAVARGLRVTALTRNAEKAEKLRADGIATVVADLAGEAWHTQMEEGAEFVVNCVSSGGGGIEGYRRSYQEGMRSAVAWMRRVGKVKTAIYTSSTSVYPQGGGATVDETAPIDRTGERPGVLAAAEDELLGAESASERRVVLRLAGIYGPGRHHLLEQVRAGEVAGRGDFHLNLIYRDDICSAVWAALEGTDAREIFNVADDEAATKAEIVAWLVKRLGVEAPRFTGEPAVGRRVVTPDRVISNAKLKLVRGWRPMCGSFREGYEKILSLERRDRLSTPNL